MKRSWWRTGPPLERRQSVVPLTASQLLRQLAVLALILLVWGGGFFFFLGAVNSSGARSVVEAVATDSPAPVPTATPSPVVTRTPLPVATATVPATAELTATTPPTAEPTAAPAADTPAAGNAAISFQRDVQPIFNQICVKCHGGEEVKEGLSLKTYAEVMQGSDNGAVIVPGDLTNSLLVKQVESGEMPKRGPKLLPRQIQAIIEWVAAGAPDN